MTAVLSSKNISSQPAGTIRCPDEQKQSSGSDKPGQLAAYAESVGRYLHAITERMTRAKTAQSRRTVPA